MLKLKPKTVVVAIPAYGGVMHTSTVESMIAMIGPCAAQNISIQFMITNGDSLVTRARNVIVSEFMEGNGDYLLFLDSDIGFTAEALIRLVRSNYPLCGTAYPKKELDWKKILKIAKDCEDEIELQARAANYVLNYDSPDVVLDGKGFARVQDLGTGFLLIKREVFTKMIEAYPELKCGAPVASDGTSSGKAHYAFFDTEIERSTGAYLSEDWFFCRQWQRLGGEVWMDTTQALSHTGMFTFRGRADFHLVPKKENPNG